MNHALWMNVPASHPLAFFVSFLTRSVLRNWDKNEILSPRETRLKFDKFSRAMFNDIKIYQYTIFYEKIDKRVNKFFYTTITNKIL